MASESVLISLIIFLLESKKVLSTAWKMFSIAFLFTATAH